MAIHRETVSPKARRHRHKRNDGGCGAQAEWLAYWPDKQRRCQQERAVAKTQRNNVPHPKIMTESQTRHDEPT